MSNLFYKNKYNKYKQKYLDLKHKLGGSQKKSIEGESKTPSSLSINKNIYIPNCQQCKILWKIKGDYIDSGGDTEVFEVCDQSNNCNYVDKVQNISSPFETEMQALISLQNKSSFIPKIFQIYTLDNKAHIIMENLLPGKFSIDEKLNILDELHKYGWYHLDAHSHNWMKRSNNEIVLIDYGESIYPEDILNETLSDIMKKNFIPRKSIRYIPQLRFFINKFSNGELNNLKLKDNMEFFKQILSFIDKMKIRRSLYSEKIKNVIEEKVKSLLT